MSYVYKTSPEDREEAQQFVAWVREHWRVKTELIENVLSDLETALSERRAHMQQIAALEDEAARLRSALTTVVDENDLGAWPQ